MEIKDDKFQTLQNKVDQISAELDKQNTVRVVNTKWMIIVGAVILSAFGFTSFVQLPREASKAIEKKVGPEIINKANLILKKSKEIEGTDFVNVPIGTIISSMLDPKEFAKTVDDPPDFDPEKRKWVLADKQKDLTGSKYYNLTGESHTPDLRGMFLRGMNVNGGGQDPDKNRKAGDKQKDALQEHGHETTATGFKSKMPDTDSKYPWSGRDLGYTSKGDADMIPAKVMGVTDKNKTSEEETRPKNIAVYFYIKIN